jgi:hypothetical protein
MNKSFQKNIYGTSALNYIFLALQYEYIFF